VAYWVKIVRQITLEKLLLIKLPHKHLLPFDNVLVIGENTKIFSTILEIDADDVSALMRYNRQVDADEVYYLMSVLNKR